MIHHRSCRQIAWTVTFASCLRTSEPAPGALWRETDEDDTAHATVLRHLLSGQYTFRLGSFASIRAKASRDATSEFADAVAQLAADTDAEVSPALQTFIAANGGRW